MSKKPETITIKGTSVKIYKFDTDFSVLQRYSYLSNASSSKKDKVHYILPTLPQYLRFVRDDGKGSNRNTFTNGKVYEIEDLRDVKDLSLSNLTKSLDALESQFKLMQKSQIVFVWLIEKGYSSISIDDFGRVYKDELDFLDDLKSKNRGVREFTRFFSNYRITHISIVKYVSDVESQVRKVQSRVQTEDSIFDTLSKTKPVDLGEFIIEGTIEEIALSFDREVSLYEVFDMLTASIILPFIVLSDGSTLFYKVYEGIRPIPEWLNIGHRPDKQPVIYFYVLDTPDENMKGLHSEDIYRGGLWQGKSDDIRESQTQHIIRVDSRGAITYFGEILESVGIKAKSTSRNFVIVNETRYETRGKFTVPNQVFNKAIFADMITNDKIFSYLLYLNESSKSILDKKRFVYYHDSKLYIERNKLDTLTITMTNVVLESDTHIDIRISRAATETQIQQFMALFSHLFSLYLEKQLSVVERYTALYNNVNFKKYEKKIKIKAIDLKTGKRLKLLEKHNASAFKHGGYSSKCQPKRRQPYLVPKSDIGKVKKKFADAEPHDLAKQLEKYGLLNWPEGSDDWYACYPREEDDDEKRHIYPGLIEQNPKASNYKEYPLLPCCFIANQFTKKGAKKAKNVVDNEPEGKEDVFDRPLSSNKATPRGRYAELPYYMQILVEISGYGTVEYRKKPFLPILRYGVIEGLDSMVHCMERAFNDDYVNMSVENRRNQVKGILSSLSQKDDEWLVVCRQEMYDYTYDEIRESLKDTNTYIDPDKYIAIFAKYYDCNIIVFSVDDNHPKGEVSLPRFAEAYLPYKFNPKGETIVLVKVQSHRARVGSINGTGMTYQCELVVKYGTSGKVDYYFSSKDKFIVACFEALSKINDVYIVSPEGDYVKYNPQILL